MIVRYRLSHIVLFYKLLDENDICEDLLTIHSKVCSKTVKKMILGKCVTKKVAEKISKAIKCDPSDIFEVVAYE